MQRYLILIFFVININLFAQKNTEQLRAFIRDGFYNSITFGFDYSAGNEDYLKLIGGYRIDFRQTQFYTFLVTNAEYKTGNNSLITNKGFAHLRFIYHNYKLIHPEVFFQIEYDDFLLIEHRELVGAGIRLDIIDSETYEEYPKIELNLGSSLMYEHEKYKLDNPSFDVQLRNSTYLSLFLFINDFFNLSFVNYIQPVLKNFHDFKVLTELKTNFSISKYLLFNFNLNYRYDNVPLPNLKYYNFNIVNGISVNF